MVELPVTSGGAGSGEVRGDDVEVGAAVAAVKVLDGEDVVRVGEEEGEVFGAGLCVGGDHGVESFENIGW